MTIKYLDSKRIVKLSTDVLNTPTLEDDFSSDDWTDVGSLGVSGGTLGGDGIIDGGDDTSYKDMTSISETAFLFRFKATYITTFGSGSASRFIHFGLSDKFAPQNTTQDFVGFSFEAWNAPAFRIGGQMRNGQTLDQPSNGNLRLSELDHSSAGTFTYWFEVIRNGNAFTLNVYSDSGYSTLVDSVTSTVTGITALRYFSCTNKDGVGSSSGTLNVAIDDLKLYNGVSSLTSKPTNVQVGSRFEETDTRKMYYRDDIDFKELDGNEATNYRSDSWYEQLSGETP